VTLQVLLSWDSRRSLRSVVTKLLLGQPELDPGRSFDTGRVTFGDFVDSVGWALLHCPIEVQGRWLSWLAARLKSARSLSIQGRIRAVG